MLVSAIVVSGGPALGQDAATQQALKTIIDTAGQICQSTPLEQTSEGVNLSSDARAKVGGIVGRLADLGVSGNGQYQSGKSMGVLQKDLVTAIQSGNNCKLEVFRTLERDLLGGRNPEHGGAAAAPPAVTASAPTRPVPPGVADMQVSALVQVLGGTEGADRYYALREGVASLDPAVRITVGDTLALLGNIRAPELRYDAATWVLPRLVTPVMVTDALRLLSGFQAYERTALLQHLAPCIERPIQADAKGSLLNGVLSNARPPLVRALAGNADCPSGRHARN